MDSHFEVILTKVRELTDKSKNTIWFEVYDDLHEEYPVLILINECNKIGMIYVSYTNEQVPELFASKITKKRYDSILDKRFDFKRYIKNINRVGLPVHDLIIWLTEPAGT